MSEPIWSMTPKNRRPEVFRNLRVTIEEDPQGWWQKIPELRRHEYSVYNVPDYLPCCNPRCRNGGLNIERALGTYGSGRHYLSCEGHEGYIRGRQKGPKCDNRFTITMTFDGSRV